MDSIPKRRRPNGSFGNSGPDGRTPIAASEIDDRDLEGIAHPDWSNYDLQGIDEAHGITYYGEVRLESHLECRLPKREPIEVNYLFRIRRCASACRGYC
jgi:hypothetical protein